MDREVLLDLDYSGETHGPDSYGSLQNGGFIPPRYVSVLICVVWHYVLMHTL